MWYHWVAFDQVCFDGRNYMQLSSSNKSKTFKIHNYSISIKVLFKTKMYSVQVQTLYIVDWPHADEMGYKNEYITSIADSEYM